MSQHPVADVEDSLPTSGDPTNCSEASSGCKESRDPACNAGGSEMAGPAVGKDAQTVLQQKGYSFVTNPLPLTEAPKETGSSLTPSSIELVMGDGKGYVTRPLPQTQAFQPNVSGPTAPFTKSVTPGQKDSVIQPLPLTSASKPRVRPSKSSATEIVVKVATGASSSLLPLTTFSGAESSSVSMPEGRGPGTEYTTPPPTSENLQIILTSSIINTPGEIKLDEQSLACPLSPQRKLKGQDLKGRRGMPNDWDDIDAESENESVCFSSSAVPNSKWKGKQVHLLIEAKVAEDKNENKDENLQLTCSPSHRDADARDAGSSTVPAAPLSPSDVGGFCADPNCDLLHRRSWSWPVEKDNTEGREGTALPW
ncbi:MAG: hypothetical protein Q9207_001049 [Kuettlingeria erythrocarpa]